MITAQEARELSKDKDYNVRLQSFMRRLDKEIREAAEHRSRSILFTLRDPDYLLISDDLCTELLNNNFNVSRAICDNDYVVLSITW
jgi:hypothetical protein